MQNVKLFSSLRISAIILFICAISSICSTNLAAAEQVTELPQDGRVVVVGGALTEIAYALGAESQIIARDTTSSYPPAALKLPDVGYMRALSPEGVLSLAPRGILLVEGSGPPPTIEILSKAAVPMVTVAEHFTRQGISEKISAVGLALHRTKEAEALNEKVRAEFSENDKLLSRIKQKKRVLFVLSVQNGRIMAAGQHTAADGIITIAGAINAIEGYDGYKLLNDEAIINAAPDLILIMDHAGITANTNDILAIPAIKATPAAQNGAIKQMDALYLLGFGPRTPLAARELINTLYHPAP
ncbi:heme/hemin ABC transporter substrate-binding protein [Bartonella sp. LJL80]